MRRANNECLRADHRLCSAMWRMMVSDARISIGIVIRMEYLGNIIKIPTYREMPEHLVDSQDVSGDLVGGDSWLLDVVMCYKLVMAVDALYCKGNVSTMICVAEICILTVHSCPSTVRWLHRYSPPSEPLNRREVDLLKCQPACQRIRNTWHLPTPYPSLSKILAHR